MSGINKPTLLTLLTGASVAAGVAAGSVAYVAATASVGPSAILEQDVRRIVAEEIASRPDAILASLEAHMQAGQAAEAAAADERVLALSGPLTDNEAYPSVGNPDGEIEVVYFFDVNCGFCKRLDPVMKRLAEENPDVRVSHREIPILSPTSRLAAFMQAVVWDAYPDRYEELHDAFIAHQGSLSERDVEAIMNRLFGPAGPALLALASRSGADEAAEAAEARIDASLDLMREAGISGTPFVFVPGARGMVRGAGDDAYDRLSEMVEAARQGG